MLRRLWPQLGTRAHEPPTSAPSSVLDELTEAILRQWHGAASGWNGAPYPYDHFRVQRFPEARREACRILALPPLDRIVAEWVLDRAGRPSCRN